MLHEIAARKGAKLKFLAYSAFHNVEKTLELSGVRRQELCRSESFALSPMGCKMEIGTPLLITKKSRTD